MTTTPDTRPSLAPKHTRASEEKRNNELDSGLRITVDGEAYEVRLGDLSPALAREIRKVTGRSFNALTDLLSEDPDIDVVTDFVWVARRIRGEDVELEDVVVGYAQLLADGFNIERAGTPEPIEDDSPEA